MKAGKKKRCAVVGFASTSRDFAPYDDKEVEIFSLNHGWTFIPRWDRWYELHRMEHLAKDLPRNGVFQDGNQHLKWLSSQDGSKPIYMLEKHAQIPASVAYPYDEVNAWLVSKGSEPDFFTSSIDYMVALALYEGFEEIGVYGVDMLNDDEYAYQRAGIEFLRGLALGMGVKFIVPKTSAIGKVNYIYGKSEPPDIETSQQRIKHSKGVLESLENDMKSCMASFHTFDGATQAWRNALDYVRRFRPRHAAREIRKQLKHAEAERTKWTLNTKHVEGGINVTTGFVSWLGHEARGGALTLEPSK